MAAPEVYSMDMQDVPFVCHPFYPLLQALVDAKGDHDKEMDIGRLVRLSSRYQAEILEASRTLVEELFKNPASIHENGAYVQNCNRLLSLSAASKEVDQSMLLSLPRELRDKIWGYALPDEVTYWQKGCCKSQTECDHEESKEAESGLMKKNYCDSKSYYGKYLQRRPHATKAVDLLTVSKQVSAETLPLFYRHNEFGVTCGCKLYKLLSRDVVRKSIQYLTFGLFGSQRLEAFALLRQCKLKELAIFIGKKSTHVFNDTHRYYLKCGMDKIDKVTPRLSDAMGVMELKGIGFEMSVHVIVLRVGAERSDREAKGFENFMNNDPNENKAEVKEGDEGGEGGSGGELGKGGDEGGEGGEGGSGGELGKGGDEGGEGGSGGEVGEGGGGGDDGGDGGQAEAEAKVADGAEDNSEA